MKYSASLNLGLVTAIRVDEGNGPGRERPVVWTFGYANKDGKETGFWASPMQLPPTGHIMIAKVHGSKPYRLAFNEPRGPGQEPMMMWMGDSHETDNNFRTLPAYAEDDVVVFLGLGASMPVPFGCGQAALRRIHAELEKGK